jgi:hypothetical protein
MRLHDPFHRCLTIRSGQRQTMPDVVAHRTNERLLLRAIEELHLDFGVTPRGSRPHPVHPVDHPHRRPVHDYGRQCLLCLGDDPHMLRVLPRKTW